MPLYPSSMLDDQFNTLSESLKVLQESMKELQAKNKCMLSSICHVRSLLQEEMRLYSTFTDTPEISDDKTITSVLESACDDNDTEIADTVKSHLDSQLPIHDVGYTIQKTMSPSVLFSASIDTTELEFSRLSFSVKELTFPVKGYGHKLDMEFDCKVFDIMRKRDIFAEFLGPHTTIGSLGLHICDWFDTGQAFGACVDKVHSGVHSLNRVLLFGCSNGFPLLSVDDTSDVGEVSSLTTAHKVFVDMLDKYEYAYSFNLDSTRPYIESESDILIMDRITLVHMIKCLQLPFDPGVYVTHEVIFLYDMCNDIRSLMHIEYPCITANHVVGVVSSGALEKYIDAYDFIQYFYFCNFNLSWQPCTIVASSHGDNNCIVLGLLEQLNTIGDVPVDLWSKSDVAIIRTTGGLQSGNWPGLILFSADQVLHIFVTNQYARTVFGRLGNPEWSCSNDINQRAGVIFVCDVLNDDPQSEKWYISVFGPAPLTGLNHLQLSNGHSIVEWVDDCSVVILWIIFASCIRLFYGLMSLRYSVTTILNRSSHIFSDAKFSLTPDRFEQFNLKLQICKFDHCWIQDGMMLEVLVKMAVLFKNIVPEVERAKDFLGEQNKKAPIPYLRKQMPYEQQVDQLENFHLPLRDQMLLLEGANTTSNTIIDALGTTTAAREVMQKALPIEDIDKIIVAISELMEIIKMLHKAFSSHVCAAADFVDSELRAANNKKEGTHNILKIMLAGYCPKIAQYVFYELLGKGNSPSAFTFSQVIQAKYVVNEVDSASSLLRDMTKLGCVPNALSHHCRALTPPQSANALVHEFISENLLTFCSTMLDLLLVGVAPNRLKMWSCSQYKIKCLLDVFEIGKRYIVLVTFLEKLSLNECKLLEVGFVGAGRIWFKLVEKVVVPGSAFRTTEILQVPVPSFHNILVELDPTIRNALRSKLHKVFNVGSLVLPSSSLKQLFDVNLVRHGCILWFKKQNDGSLLQVALDNEVFKEFLWVVNTYKEEHDNTVVSL
ncbi:hypothetical protein MTR67_006275 [Solanum verrucosum]|uniref:Uncharacterized protein n=1 Tax=Solanum verrucosum TaxID=315347 RepID=A0AAF0PZV8_SOLVR|nr:hypothetical protein MTR67_006275 [Solanum verrucosum]